MPCPTGTSSSPRSADSGVAFAAAERNISRGLPPLAFEHAPFLWLRANLWYRAVNPISPMVRNADVFSTFVRCGTHLNRGVDPDGGLYPCDEVLVTKKIKV